MNEPNIIADELYRLNAVDGEWYLANYLDVSQIGMSPELHYVKYGEAMKRRPTADFDPEYYSTTYSDTPPNSPNLFLHYIKNDAHLKRPTCEESVQKFLTNLRASQSDVWPNITSMKLISYCIPIMNRGQDLRLTLEYNLQANRLYSDVIEFIILFFDNDQETKSWIRNTFTDDISIGYLRVEESSELSQWHFGKAKNAFKSLLYGKTYSSLDGDNYVTADETASVLHAIQEYGDNFIFHHFLGSWGDGSSGRVTVPTLLYRHCGYDSGFLPRQYDEIDMILSTLIASPSASFICYGDDYNVLMKSNRTRQFMAAERVANPIVHFRKPYSLAPNNPKKRSYVQEDQRLKYMTDFNQALSYIKNSRNLDLRDNYIKIAMDGKRGLLRSTGAVELSQIIFSHIDPNWHASVTEIAAFMVVKDDHQFLTHAVRHYRSLGIRDIFIIDDGSEPRVDGDELGVHVVTPEVGSFLTSKTLWLEVLMKLVLAEGAWALTVDADELIDVPLLSPDKGLIDVINEAESSGCLYVPGLLMDMLPEDPFQISVDQDIPTDFPNMFNYFANVSSTPTEDYINFPAIKWAFGAYAGLSWSVDSRYHIFGTFDSLRKIPLFKYSPDISLNQGFHTLYFSDRSEPCSSIWQSPIILPIRHYKLTKLFFNRNQARNLSNATQYHRRTANNIRLIFSDSNINDIREKIKAVPRTKYTYEAASQLRLHALSQKEAH